MTYWYCQILSNKIVRNYVSVCTNPPQPSCAGFKQQSSLALWTFQGYCDRSRGAQVVLNIIFGMGLSS